MAERWSESLFRAAALTSGLVDQEEIDQAIGQLAAVGANTPSTEAVAFSDDHLADKLVELGHLNRWQAEQLKAGRTRFRLGDYRIVDSIGQGGMGQVFKAVHTLLGRVEAIKVLPRGKSTPEAIDSFRREIRAQAQLDHPNLVRVSYAGFDGNVYYLVTQYVPGADLRQLVRTNGKLDMQQAASIIIQAAKGLRYIHQNGLIHRDVKPGNLLVTPDGHTKVSDMGLFGFTIGSDGEDPREGKIVGTADYLSPEQILTPRSVTPAADVYALGCTLYYAISGKVPYPGGTTKEKAHRHCNDTPLHPRHFNASLSGDFVEVIADMMEKKPSNRIATAQEVIGRLSPYLSDSETIGPAVRMSRRLATPPPAPGRKAGSLSDTASDIFDFPQIAGSDSDPGGEPSQETEVQAQFDQETEAEAAPADVTPPEAAAVEQAVVEEAVMNEAVADDQPIAEVSETLEVALPADPRKIPPPISRRSIDPPKVPATREDKPATDPHEQNKPLRPTILRWVRGAAKRLRQTVLIVPRTAEGIAILGGKTEQAIVSIPTLLKVTITLAVVAASIAVTLLIVYLK